MYRIWLSVILFALVAGTVRGVTAPVSSAASAKGFYHTAGNRILDAGGTQAIFNGINWFGFETANYAPHGLWSRSMNDMLDQVKQQGYNLIRLPFSNEMFNSTSVVSGVDYNKNPDLKGLKPIEIMDKLVTKAGARGIQIILDRHRPDSGAQSELWYTAAYSEERWIKDWTMLAKRYKGNSTVIGADLHNEPHGQASWGTGDTRTDWRLAAQRAGNAIGAVNSKWLILVEGVEKNVKGQTSSSWWGGNLKGVAAYPVKLKIDGRVVYSPHDYGPGVSDQSWFHAANFPTNLSAVWDANWGYIHKQGIAPVLIGEFGGRAVDTVSLEGKWQNALVRYIANNKLYWTYWTLNPNSGDTGGLLQDDWTTWNAAKQKMLTPIMNKSTSVGGKVSIPVPSVNVPMPTVRVSSPTVQQPTATPAACVTSDQQKTSLPRASSSSDTKGVKVSLLYQGSELGADAKSIHANIELLNEGSASLSLSDLVLRYWYTAEGIQEQSFYVDYAKLGNDNITGRFVALAAPRNGADVYVEIGFTSVAGKLLPGEDTGEIKLRFNKNDWSPYNRANDYSFDAQHDSYQSWDQITAYYKGSLIYGIEP